MTTGLKKSLELLAATNNEAATNLLLAALDSADRDIQTSALRCLLKRRSSDGHARLLKRWDTLSDRHKVTIADQAHRMSGALRNAVLSTEHELCEKGLDAAVRLREYDLLPTLITAAEDKANPRAENAARTVLALAELLYDEITSPRDYRTRRDPQRTRKYAASSLEESVKRFDQHRRSEILESYLLLTTPDSALLRQLLQNIHGKAYLQVIQLLGHSTRPGIQELLLGFLDDPHVPSTVHATLSRRRDMPFLRRFFQRYCPEPSKHLRLCARKIETFAWVEDADKILKAVSDEEQQGMVQLAMVSGINRLNAFEIVRLGLKQGRCLARRSASNFLQEFHGADANHLILACLNDEDSQVQANVVGQLRERGIPGAMQKLLQLIESADPLVGQAARAALGEFSFERLISSFDLLSEDVASSTGRLVKSIDPDALKKLSAEFESPSRTRRLRALSVSIAMGAVQDVEREVLNMVTDREESDHFIRAEAARALALCESTAARAALRELLLDHSPSVREAAEQSLQSLADSTTKSALVAPDLSDTTANLMQFSRESLP